MFKLLSIVCKYRKSNIGTLISGILPAFSVSNKQILPLAVRNLCKIGVVLFVVSFT